MCSLHVIIMIMIFVMICNNDNIRHMALCQSQSRSKHRTIASKLYINGGGALKTELSGVGGAILI